MTYTFIINGQLSNLNDYLKAERVMIRGRNGKITTKGNNLKHDTQDKIIIPQIRRDLKSLRIRNKAVRLNYTFYEPNKKRDLDNIAAFAMKVIQDSLVLCGVLENDGWKQIAGFTCDFNVDAKNPRIVVEIVEE